ncbi:acyltransferase family protein [Algoriphagus yeomjeoni]|uniref:acyltransferase family protein n=1 Tax=Algoriphagus yeomjeoni TaxID=291403 RepID=UPI003CE4E040
MDSRNFGLDAVRAIAIIFVLVSHSNDMLPLVIRPYMNLISFDGVTIFFVLSGFLIGGIILKDIETHPLNFKYLKFFWNRRWLRTLPNYFLILLILLAIAPRTVPMFERVKSIPYFFFSQNLWYPHPEKFFTEAWSLSVEEWFYFIFPLLLLFNLKIQKNIHKAIITTALIVISFSIFSRIFVLFNVEIPSKDWVDLNIRKMVVTRFDSLFIGVIGAYIYKYYNGLFFKSTDKLFIIGITIYLFFEIILNSSFNKTILIIYPLITSISILMVFPKIILLKTPCYKFKLVITHISLISYSLYLTNLALVKRSILKDIHLRNEELDVVFRYLLFWVSCIFISTFLYRFFEKPIMKLRKKTI